MANTLPNMGLKQWNLAPDTFSYTELAQNFQLLDDHDHTTGKGLQIPTGGIANLAVTTGKVADGAITTAKLAKEGLGYGAGAFYVYRTGGGTWGDLSFFNFDTKDYDLNNWYNTTTSRYTPQIKGIYHLHAQVTLTTTLATPGTSWAAINVYKNGSDYRAGPQIPQVGSAMSVSAWIDTYLDANGTTDYFQIVFFTNNGSAVSVNLLPQKTFMAGYLVAPRT
jgi:hypothetical protein